jgi:succinoglycan biosynthesis protein ExoM
MDLMTPRSEQASLLVAIITCRRPDGLGRLLSELRDQRSEACRFEILVVDNDSSRSGKPVVARHVDGNSTRLIYVHEPQQGIVFARNRCVEVFLESDHDALVFIDDDEWPARSNWLETLTAAWDGSRADIVTSHVVSIGGSDVPAWALEILYGKHHPRSGANVTKFYTNNLLLSRRVLEAVRPAFDARFAMTGASDYHFCLKCIRSGFSAIYANAPVKEEFPAERATVAWFVKRGFRSGVGHTRSHLFEEGWTIAGIKAIYLSAGRFALGCGFLVKGVVTVDKADRVKGLFRVASAVGAIAGLVGVTHDEYRTAHE